MRSGREKANPVRTPGTMLRPVSGVTRQRAGYGRRRFPAWHEISVSLPARCHALIGVRFPVRRALVAVIMAVAALCAGNRAHAQQETLSLQSFIPPASEQATPFSGLSPQAVIQTSSPADTVHFCLPDDLDEQEHDRSIFTARKQGDLNVSEPHTVRMIVFVPNDRPFHAGGFPGMQEEIIEAQTFYADEMQAHGYGDKTFRFETDAQGEPLVHQVGGKHSNSYYLEDTYRRVGAEIEQTFDLYANVYLIVVSNGTGIVTWQGQSWLGVGGRRGKNGGLAVVASSNSYLWAHELGHAFGLEHDFRDKAYIMSYGGARDRLSACNAEFLAVHPFFNIESSIYREAPPSIELVSPAAYPADSERVPVQIGVSDLEGLHQSILFVRTIAPHPAEGCGALSRG